MSSNLADISVFEALGNQNTTTALSVSNGFMPLSIKQSDLNRAAFEDASELLDKYRNAIHAAYVQYGAPFLDTMEGLPGNYRSGDSVDSNLSASEFENRWMAAMTYQFFRGNETQGMDPEFVRTLFS